MDYTGNEHMMKSSVSIPVTMYMTKQMHTMHQFISLSLKVGSVDARTGFQQLGRCLPALLECLPEVLDATLYLKEILPQSKLTYMSGWMLPRVVAHLSS